MQQGEYMGELSDHMDSNLFSYNRTWVEMEDMLDKAERKMNHHFTVAHNCKHKDEKIYHMRNYKALEGVVKTLRWVLGDIGISHPLE